MGITSPTCLWSSVFGRTDAPHWILGRAPKAKIVNTLTDVRSCYKGGILHACNANPSLSTNVVLLVNWLCATQFFICHLSSVCSQFGMTGGKEKGEEEKWEEKLDPGRRRRRRIRRRRKKNTLTSLSSAELILCLAWILRGAGYRTESGFMLCLLQCSSYKIPFNFSRGLREWLERHVCSYRQWYH